MCSKLFQFAINGQTPQQPEGSFKLLIGQHSTKSDPNPQTKCESEFKQQIHLIQSIRYHTTLTPSHKTEWLEKTESETLTIHSFWCQDLNSFINISETQRAHSHHVCTEKSPRHCPNPSYTRPQSQNSRVHPPTARTQTLHLRPPKLWNMRLPPDQLWLYIPSDLRSVKCRPRFHSFPDAQGFTDTTPKGMGFNTRERERERERVKKYLLCIGQIQREWTKSGIRTIHTLGGTRLQTQFTSVHVAEAITRRKLINIWSTNGSGRQHGPLASHHFTHFYIFDGGKHLVECW